MASQQERRRDEKASEEREIHVQKDRVPKLATHFESLSEKTRDEHEHGLKKEEEEDRQKKETTRDAARGSHHDASRKEQRKEREKETPSLEEISQLRGKAQQNSAEAIRGAEERYAQKTEEAKQGMGGSAANIAKEKGAQAKDVLVQSAYATSQYVAEKAAPVKDSAVEKGAQATDYARKKAAEAKDATLETGKVAALKASEAAKAATAKAGDVAVQVKDTTIETGKSAATKAGNVAVQAKDAAIGTGKSVIPKAREATASTVESGKGAAQYAAAKAADAMRATAGYTTEKAAATKDTVEGRGVKKEEAGESEGKTGEDRVESVEVGVHEERVGSEGRGGILEAIGETVVEIAQTTKHLVAGNSHGIDKPSKKQDH